MSDRIKLEESEFKELDYFVLQGQFTPEAVEVTYIDPRYQADDAGIVTTIAMNIEEDPEAIAILRQAQESLNWLVIHATQKIRDAQ